MYTGHHDAGILYEYATVTFLAFRGEINSEVAHFLHFVKKADQTRDPEQTHQTEDPHKHKNPHHFIGFRGWRIPMILQILGKSSR